jgi:hypothetical protein
LAGNRLPAELHAENTGDNILPKEGFMNTPFCAVFGIEDKY